MPTTTATTVKGPHNEDYDEFYQHWSVAHEEQMRELQEALKSNASEAELRALVSKAEAHYDFYYGAKDDAAKQNILQVMSPPWKTPLETAFAWVGGWRPSMVFQLAYALAGQHTEAELAELLEGISTPTMASLTSHQLEMINDLQLKTQKKEDELSHRLAVVQQAMADQPFVCYVQAGLSADDGNENENEDNDSESHGDGMMGAVDEKLKDMEQLLIDADHLRKETLHKMLEILTVLQAAQYLITAAQLQIAFRKAGVIKSAA